MQKTLTIEGWCKELQDSSRQASGHLSHQCAMVIAASVHRKMEEVLGKWNDGDKFEFYLIQGKGETMLKWYEKWKTFYEDGITNIELDMRQKIASIQPFAAQVGKVLEVLQKPEARHLMGVEELLNQEISIDLPEK